MARGWHYAKFSLSSALCLSFSGMCTLLLLFLSLCRFCLFVFVKKNQSTPRPSEHPLVRGGKRFYFALIGAV